MRALTIGVNHGVTEFAPERGWRLSGPIKKIDVVSRREARRRKLKGICR